MAKHPEVQSKVRKEIENEIGFVRDPSMNDKSNLKYCEAVILEILRFSTLVPLAIAHCTMDDVKLREYDIPKGAIVFPNIFAVHRESESWPDANHFNPEENFIIRDENGSISGFKNMDKLIPFSLGPRKCPGEVLARQELFIFFTGILQRFEFIEDPDNPLPSEHDAVITVLRNPVPYTIKIRPV